MFSKLRLKPRSKSAQRENPPSSSNSRRKESIVIQEGSRNNESFTSVVQQNDAKPIEIDGRYSIYSVAFLPDGKHIVSGGEEGKIRRWRVADGREVGVPIDAASVVWCVAVSQDGKWIVAGTDGGQLVWNAESRRRVTEFKGTATVHTVDISLDGTRVAIGADDAAVCVWSLPNGQRLLGPLRHDLNIDSVLAVKFSPDGRLIAAALWYHKSIRVYDSHDDGHVLVNSTVEVGWAHGNANASITWTSDSKQLFFLSDDGYINCIDVSVGAILYKWLIHSNKRPWCIGLASNGVFLAVSHQSSVSFWDIRTHKQIGSVISHTHIHEVSSMVISPNFSIVVSGDDKIIVLRDLRGALPTLCFDRQDVLSSAQFNNQALLDQELRRVRAEKADLKKTVESLCEKGVRSNEKIEILEKTAETLRNELADSHRAVEWAKRSLEEAVRAHETNSKKLEKLENIVDELRVQLTDSQRATKQAKDSLNDTVGSLRVHLRSQETSSSSSLVQILCAHERKHRCEALFDEGRIMDAAMLLLEITNATSEAVKTDRTITCWLPEFTDACITKLKEIGDQASGVGKHDDALAAYSIGLSLGPSSTNVLLMRWAREMLLHHSINEVLDAASTFKLEHFDIYRAVCEALEGNERAGDAVECFQQMQRELVMNQSNEEEQAHWELDFRRRCTKQLEKLGDIAMGSQNYEEALNHFSAILSLDPENRVGMLVKRSKARASMKSWKEALSDAEEAIRLDPSCYQGYDIKHTVLHGAKRYAEAVQTFDTMLLRLEESSDERVRELRHQYVDARPTIRRVIDQTTRLVPRVLIDVTTGHLCNKKQLSAAFEALPIYDMLVSSMTTELDYARIYREVKEFYRYVMLSHRWQNDEPLLREVELVTVYKLNVSPANIKLQSFCSLVHSLGFRWAWSDTCCIDKDNNVVLQESLVAMFIWYRGSSLTIVYLLGVLSQSQEPGDLRGSIWNMRAWTYQEYIAAKIVQFYTEDWKPYLGLTIYNHKESPQVIAEMEQVSGVSEKELAVLSPGLDRVREKLHLASARQTTLVEDVAYSLLGIFNVSIPVIYGEGNRAVGRLLEHILTGSGDVTVLAWTGRAGTYNSCLPMDLTVYHQLVPPHVPPDIVEAAEVDQEVMALGTSLLDPTLVTVLFDRLHNLPSPSIASSRLRLPGIIFHLTDLAHISGPDSETHSHEYRVTTYTFGDINIKTADNLKGTKDLYLVHPWIRPLLDQEFACGAAGLDKMTQGLRLIVRLRQPFGALLFKPLSRVEYQRVAADCLIMVRIGEDVPLIDLVDNIRMIEVH